MKQILILLAGISLMIQLCACHDQSSQISVKESSNNFLKKFYSQRPDEYKLLLGCFIYAQKNRNKLKWDDRDAFLALTISFQHKWSSAYSDTKLKSLNAIDSVIESYASENKDINFITDQAYLSISHFIESYNMVEDIVFVKIQSDTDLRQMKIADKKILKIPELAKIYKLYITHGQQGISSLESTNGVSFDIQIAYYLDMQTDDRRAEIIKGLL